MFQATQQFINALEAKGRRYNYEGESSSGQTDIVSASFKGKNTSVKVVFFFDKGNENAAMRVFDVTRYSADKAETMLKTVNELNRQYKYAKAVMDTDDNTVQFEMDAVFRTPAIGEICDELLTRMVLIVDEAYPTLMRAIYA